MPWIDGLGVDMPRLGGARGRADGERRVLLSSSGCRRGCGHLETQGRENLEIRMTQEALGANQGVNPHYS